MAQSNSTQIGDVVVSNAFAYASLEGVTTGSCFMTFQNAGNSLDWLTGAEPADNQPFDMAMPMTFAIDQDGTWSMITLEPSNSLFYQIAPGVPTVLTPGYAHIMLMNLSAPLQEGEVIELELTFERSGSGTVEIDVIPYP